MGADGSGPDPVAVASRRWFAAEEQLYPQIMMEPQVYERVVRVVGAVVGQLRERSAGAQDLLELEGSAEQLPTTLAEQLAEAPEVSDRVLFAAACALRYRELPEPG